MNNDLLQEFMELNEEERSILEQKKEIKKDLYTSQRSFVIESEKLLDHDKMIMVRKHTRFVDFPKHTHNYIEINYVFNGELHQTVGEEKLCLKKGELLFLNQHIDHEIEASGREDIIINFIIQPQFFEYIFSFLSTDNRISNFIINSLYNNTQDGHFLYFAVAEVEIIQKVIGRIIDEIRNPSLLSDSSIKLYIGLLMIELIKHSDKLKRNEVYSSRQFIMLETMKYIDKNYRNASLYELAHQLNQSYHSLSKHIKNATNCTFKSLVQEKRLTIARQLLENTDLSIAEIVDRTGYDNVSYFYRIFRDKFGHTPKELREQSAQ
ncbi:AraC family transcriptional regulator [Fictibacillus fluitans]|uniref:AraC family transcriptional regulator n=1 Tax=Fictibacillus fluitans TaxID=3058422 RepID=A0ABT8I0U8_9BACL|nr:AraC family transcriptional regulator [Fictibacillus sp. NE201]MDN4526650.1 AraC family transcriptional regulator [Fictibacillus sp. NE201]